MRMLGSPSGQVTHDILVRQIAELVVEAVNLHHVDPATLGPDTQLTQGGLSLDSVDILEVVVALEHRYGVKIRGAEQGREVFRTLGTIAAFVRGTSPLV